MSIQYDAISDILFDALQEIEQHETILPRAYTGALKAKVTRMTEAMRKLHLELFQHEVDTKVVTQARAHVASKARAKLSR